MVLYVHERSRFLDLNETASNIFEQLIADGATMSSVTEWCDRTYATRDQSFAVVTELITRLNAEGVQLHLRA
jgi:hypothetical protein